MADINEEQNILVDIIKTVKIIFFKLIIFGFS